MSSSETKKPQLRTVVISAHDKTLILPGEERSAGLTAVGRKKLENSATAPASPQPAEVRARRLRGQEAFPLQPIPEEVVQITRVRSIKALIRSKRARAALIGIIIGASFIAGVEVMNECKGSSSMQSPAGTRVD